MNTATDGELDGPASGPGVSVVVPSYNHARFVGKCLGSIINQTRAPLELIVIDDGSADGSPQVIERALKQCPFPSELIVRPNKGLCATLNEGLSRSRGRYFAYLASDDIWLPSFLRARVALLDARPDALLAYGHAYVCDEHDRVIECTKEWASYADGDARRMLLWSTAPPSPTVLYRQKALERYGWNESAALEDYELYLRLSADGEFAFDPQVLAVWRQHGANTSRDLRMMIDQSLDAQRKAAAMLGLSRSELESIHAALVRRYAEDFMRRGEKREALALLRPHLDGVSGYFLARILFRLSMPHRIVRWRRGRLQRRAIERYGEVLG